MPVFHKHSIFAKQSNKTSSVCQSSLDTIDTNPIIIFPNRYYVTHPKRLRIGPIPPLRASRLVHFGDDRAALDHLRQSFEASFAQDGDTQVLCQYWNPRQWAPQRVFLMPPYENRNLCNCKNSFKDFNIFLWHRLCVFEMFGSLFFYVDDVLWNC
ncbi:hypothetical protein CEXT_591081 [Caerostris extrusa]|uniref:Uncharacterized protein n=1 Tax=Caerostris extrusa TaxID=172846 RepID=A0AAV4VWV5_CAEEX|nr:hypothetical protein CEXT_591081 [Caerostris extrusa]